MPPQSISVPASPPAANFDMLWTIWVGDYLDARKAHKMAFVVDGEEASSTLREGGLNFVGYPWEGIHGDGERW